MQRQTPPFRADMVGSLLRTAPLKEARERRARGEIDAAALRAIEDEEIVKLIARQERIGLKGITDGEFRRRYWHIDFLASFTGVSVVEAAINAKFHTKEGDLEWRPPALRVSGRLARPHSIMSSAFGFVKS